MSWRSANNPHTLYSNSLRDVTPSTSKDYYSATMHMNKETADNFNPNEYTIPKEKAPSHMKSEFNSKVVNENLAKLKNLRNKTKSMNSYIHNFKPKGNKLADTRCGKCAECLKDVEVTECMLAKVPLITSDMSIPLEYEKLVKLPFIKQGILTRKYLK